MARRVSSSSPRAPRKRGRPPKYGQPSRVVALTLPVRVIDALQRRHEDLGWAIVDLVEQTKPSRTRQVQAPHHAAELVEVGGGQMLIVVDPEQVHPLPGVRMIPLSEKRAFLALAPGRGLQDLELAVLDRLASLPAGAARRKAEQFAEQLSAWRRGTEIAFETRTIILAMRTRKRVSRP